MGGSGRATRAMPTSQNRDMGHPVSVVVLRDGGELGGGRIGNGVFLMRYPGAECWGGGVVGRYSGLTAILPRPCSGLGGDEEDRFEAWVRI
jgi:hypothetical protein